VQKTVNAAAELLTDPDTVLVRRLGVDEHRYRPDLAHGQDHFGVAYL
jgi:hypothetical protein